MCVASVLVVYDRCNLMVGHHRLALRGERTGDVQADKFESLVITTLANPGPFLFCRSSHYSNRKATSYLRLERGPARVPLWLSKIMLRPLKAESIGHLTHIGGHLMPIF